MIAIEDLEFLRAVARGEPFSPSFEVVLAYVSVQDVMLRSWESGRWETVRSLREE